MHEHSRTEWTSGLDAYGAIMGGLLPLGLVIGNIGFELIIATVGCAWIVRSILNSGNAWPALLRHPLVLPWLAWLASVYISLLWNGAGGKGWMHDLALVRYFLYVAALIDISGRRAVFKYFLIGMAAAVVWGLGNMLLAYAVGYDIFGRSLSRYSWKIKDAGRIASVAAYVGPYFLTWSLFDRQLLPRRRKLIAIVGLIALGQVFFIHVRTVEVAVSAGLGVAWVYATHQRAGTIYAVLLCAGAAMLAGLIIAFGPHFDLASIYDRIGYWKVGWVMWKENPLFGVSVSNWQEAYRVMAASKAVSPFVAPDGQAWKALEAAHAHSLYLQIVSSTGLVGMFSFAWLFVNALRMVWHKRPVCGYAMLTWPVVFLVIGITGWNIYGSQYQSLFAFFMTLTAVCKMPRSAAVYPERVDRS